MSLFGDKIRLSEAKTHSSAHLKFHCAKTSTSTTILTPTPKRSTTTQISKTERLDSIIRKYGFLQSPRQAREGHPCPRPYRYATPFC